MYNIYLSTMLLVTLSALSANAEERFPSDLIKTSSGDLKITFIGHASLIFSFNNKTVYVDPFSRLADYSTLPKTDVIVITHEHRDHLDPAAIEMARLKNIDIAFLPMNLPYTMTPEMTAAAKMIQPKILYPYHYGPTDTSLLTALLKDQKGIEVRIRKME
ncbi:MAG: MBL fold metallo-hydrolase [Betaproteobacteria bacterium]